MYNRKFLTIEKTDNSEIESSDLCSFEIIHIMWIRSVLHVAVIEHQQRKKIRHNGNSLSAARVCWLKSTPISINT
jgi:hypothetical protein